MTSESLEPAAYRVKDFADGWILCQTAAEAKRYSAAGHLVEPLYAAPPQGAGGDVGKLRRALEDTHCALVAVVAAMKREPAMQHRRFDGLGIQAHDAINKAAQALATPSSEGDGKAKAPVTSEELAQFLHDEFDEPEKLTGGVWPLDDNDDGYRGDGAYVRLQPKYVVERYRDAGRRLAAWLARRATPSQVSPAIGGDYAPVLIAFDDPPRIEYLSADVPVISRRIDERMDLLLDMDGREPIGFRLYGQWTVKGSLGFSKLCLGGAERSDCETNPNTNTALQGKAP